MGEPGGCRAGGRKACAGTGVLHLGCGGPCSRLSRRGQQQQAGELLPDQPGLSKSSCCLYSRGEAQNRPSPLPVGKAALGEWPSQPGEGFSTHQVVFSQPGRPCPPRSVPAFMCFLCLLCSCKPCDVFQTYSSAAARALVCFLLGHWLWPVTGGSLSPVTFLLPSQGRLPETFRFPEAW